MNTLSGVPRCPSSHPQTQGEFSVEQQSSRKMVKAAKLEKDGEGMTQQTTQRANEFQFLDRSPALAEEFVTKKHRVSLWFFLAHV
jgi:hypothetical protein